MTPLFLFATATRTVGCTDVYVPRSAGLPSCACSEGSPVCVMGLDRGPCSVRYWVETCLSTAICVDSCILLPICQDVARTGFKPYMGRPSSDEVAFHVLRDQALLIGTVGRSLAVELAAFRATQLAASAALFPFFWIGACAGGDDYAAPSGRRLTRATGGGGTASPAEG